MLNRLTYDYTSDYYRLGGLLYFFIFKTFPNYVKREKNLTEIVIKQNEVKNISSSCIDFINKLIITNYKKRIGFNDVNELKNHHWFKNFNWAEFVNKKMKSPFTKQVQKDLGLCKKPYNFTGIKTIFFNRNILHNVTLKNIFLNFDKTNGAIVSSILKSFKHKTRELNS